jgi:hypothetical protein
MLEVGSSPVMEFAGFCRSIERLFGLSLVVKTFVSDRLSTINNSEAYKGKVVKHNSLL